MVQRRATASLYMALQHACSAESLNVDPAAQPHRKGGFGNASDPFPILFYTIARPFDNGLDHMLDNHPIACRQSSSILSLGKFSLAMKEP